MWYPSMAKLLFVRIIILYDLNEDELLWNSLWTRKHQLHDYYYTFSLSSFKDNKI